MSEVLDWDHPVADVPEDGLSIERAATDKEREEISRTLDLVACPSFVARYRIKPRSNGNYHLEGSLEATVEQTCVVTLEPLTNKVAQTYAVDFWPESEVPEPSGGLVDVHDEPDMEPIVGGRIEAGRIIFECLASSIDLFPRKPGATFETPPEGAQNAGPKPEGPFAALAKMRPKQ